MYNFEMMQFSRQIAELAGRIRSWSRCNGRRIRVRYLHQEKTSVSQLSRNMLINATKRNPFLANNVLLESASKQNNNQQSIINDVKRCKDVHCEWRDTWSDDVDR